MSKVKLTAFLAAALIALITFSTALNYNSYKYRYKRALSMIDNGKYNEAISEFRTLSNTSLGKKYSEEIEKEMRKAEAFERNKVLYDEAMKFLKDMKYLEAIESLKKIPKDDINRYVQANKKIDECISLYSAELIEISRHMASIYHYEEAVEYLQSVLAVDEGNKDAAALMEGYIKKRENAEWFGKKYGFKAIIEDNSATIIRCVTSGTEITVPEKIDGITVKVIGSQAFMGYMDMVSVLLPQSISTIETEAFSSCQSLKYITIPKNVEKIQSDIFSKCVSLKDIYVDPENKHFSELDGVLFNKDKTTLIAYPEGKKNESYTVPSSVKKIDSIVFIFRPMNLKTIVIPSTVTDFPENHIFPIPEEITLKVKAGSPAETYAKKCKFKYEFY